MSQAKPSTTEIKHWNKLITCKIKCKEMTIDKCMYLYTKFLSLTITHHLSRKIIACHRHSISKRSTEVNGEAAAADRKTREIWFISRFDPNISSFFALPRFNRAVYFSASFHKLDTWNGIE